MAGPGAMAVSWVTHPEEDDALALRAGVEVAATIAQDGAWEGHRTLSKHHPQRTCEALARQVNSLVRYGTAPARLASAAEGNRTCYASDDYSSGTLHTVLLGVGEGGPLAPNTQYFYMVGDSDGAQSEALSFTTPPLTGPESLPYRLGLIGDLGQTENSAQTLEHLTASDAASVINVGDLSYADGYQPRWDSYMRLAAPHTQRVAWALVEGNHEEEMFDGEEGWVAYERRFWFPSAQCGSNTPFYYSYEVAGAHVVMLGSYAAYLEDSEQFAWLRRDLASVDRSRTPWLIAVMHAPWYNSNEKHQHEVDDMAAAMEPVLYEFGADVVFAGHVHAYERSYRSFRGERNECGPMYINIGDGGNREGLNGFLDPQPKWSTMREPSYGHGSLLLQNTTHALWQWHRNQDAVRVTADEG
ncbi:hypothetical protein WJX81_004210 [Elliptochloris bilobata]|uniref:Purple acid phosphatase n=1 Tax=Elliptochloris bilobata TaxID=381761 RepID=A0AAW1QW31_9CHLO